MAKYFRGKHSVGNFTQIVENGRARIDCQILEEWEDIDQSTTARCGLEGSCTVEKTIGVGEKGTYTLKGVIESTIGIKDLLSLKSQVEEAVGHEVNWSTTVTTTKTFPYKAPR